MKSYHSRQILSLAHRHLSPTLGIDGINSIPSITPHGTCGGNSGGGRVISLDPLIEVGIGHMMAKIAHSESSTGGFRLPYLAVLGFEEEPVWFVTVIGILCASCIRKSEGTSSPLSDQLSVGSSEKVSEYPSNGFSKGTSKAAPKGSSGLYSCSPSNGPKGSIPSACNGPQGSISGVSNGPQDSICGTCSASQDRISGPSDSPSSGISNMSSDHSNCSSPLHQAPKEASPPSQTESSPQCSQNQIEQDLNPVTQIV